MRAAFAPIVFAAAALFAALAEFAPAQVPAADDPQTDYHSPELCENLGGQLQDAPDGQQKVCAGMDTADSFCIVGSADAFPCRGLYKHVIQCNAKHNRPARDMFFCAPRCDDDTGQKARGAKCERTVAPDNALSVRVLSLTVDDAFSGVARTISANPGHTLDFSPLPSESGVSLSALPSGDWAVEITRPPGKNELRATAIARILCHQCYPSPLTVSIIRPPPPLFAFNQAEFRRKGDKIVIGATVRVGFENRRLSVAMRYHGIRRGLRVMVSEEWSLYQLSSVDLVIASDDPSYDYLPGAHQLPREFGMSKTASKICNRDGWRIPTVGEIIGASSDDAGPLTVVFAGSPHNAAEHAPAGARAGMLIPLPPPAANDDAPPAESGFYEMDSRNLRGGDVPVRHRADFVEPYAEPGVRFHYDFQPRWVMCVLETDAATKSPQLAGLRLESGGKIIGDPVTMSFAPFFTVTATMRVDAEAGDDLFVGTIAAWKNKHYPLPLSGQRPQVRRVDDGAEVELRTADARGDSGTEMRVVVADPRPPILLDAERRTTMILEAWPALGISATIAAEIVMLPGAFRVDYPTLATRADTGEIIGTLSAVFPDGSSAPPDERHAVGSDIRFVAAPAAAYYAHSWTGDCAGQPAGDPSESGAEKECVLSDLQFDLTVGVVFALDECRGGALSCEPADQICVDTDHLLHDPSTLECGCPPNYGRRADGECGPMFVHIDFDPAPNGGRVTVYYTDAPRANEEIRPGDAVSTMTSIPIMVRAIPDPDYYVYEWTGACAPPLNYFTRTGSANNPGAVVICLADTDRMGDGKVGAIFGRDECGTNKGGCAPFGSSCSDPNPAIEGDVNCECSPGLITNDNGRTCMPPPPGR